jgi:3'-5' exoribonuclease
MSHAKIARLSELKQGDTADFFAVLASRKRDTTRDGKPYYVCRFRDARRTVSMVVWQDSGLFESCQSEWREGQCFKIRAAYGEHERYGPQIEVLQIRPVRDEDREHGFDPLEFVERSRFDPAATFAELRKLIEAEIADEPLRRLVLTLLDRNRERLFILPASLRHYHPFAGGWLEHTLSVTRTCLMLIERYRAHYAELKPPLNRDLLVAAAALHEIGRVADFDSAIPPRPTVAGHLIGHLSLGRDLVRDAAREHGDVNPELLQLLEHLLVSYLALPEWGSQRLPAIPEVLILHHADDLDAKLEMYVRCLTRDLADGPLTDPDPVLKKQLFKGRSI